MLNTQKSKTLILLTGFACNNNCVMCSLETYKQGKNNRTTDELLSDIKKGKKDGFSRIEFTGGEPTIRNDILKLIEYSKSLGFKEIGVSTNGRIFSYAEFCKKFVKSGLNRVNISLYGHTSKLHNAITRTPGSFDETIQGIKNIKNFDSIALELNTVVSKINYLYMNSIANFILHFLGIQRWVIIDLIPDGNALNLYSALSVNLKNSSKILSDVFEIHKNSFHLSFFDFPLCVFPLKMRQSKKTSYIVAKSRNEISEQRGYYSSRIKKEGSSYKDKYKVRIAVCKNCVFVNKCGGIWKKYVEIYGEKIFSSFVSKNGCLTKI